MRALACWLVFATLGASANAAPELKATASLPLEQLLPLLGDKPGSARPPVDAVLLSSQLHGRATADGLRVDGHFEVEVLADDRWALLCLLDLGEGGYLESAPKLEDATVAVSAGQLCLISKSAGVYTFDAPMVIRAAARGADRAVRLRTLAGGPRGPLELDLEPHAFALVEPAGGGARTTVDPTGGSYAVRWRLRDTARPTVAAARPPVEPRIRRATASWVSTLEGHATLRVAYEIELDRATALEIDLPEGHRLDRVTVNDIPADTEAPHGKLHLTVAPAQVGGAAARVELTLTRTLGVFNLSGRLALALPRASLPIAQVVARAHLPAVFSYARQGGSLEEWDKPDEPDAVEAALPGKTLAFRQQLVAATAPTLDLGYDVDLSGAYFRARAR